MEQVPPDEAETTETQSKWKRLSDLALSQSKFDLAESAGKRSVIVFTRTELL